MALPKVPCRVCGTPTTATALKICESCWEVERRIDGFVKHPEGRRIVLEALKDNGSRLVVRAGRGAGKSELMTLLRGMLRRESPTEAFDALDNPALQYALQRAAKYDGYRTVVLPQELGDGCIMVPTPDGPRAVAYKGRKAWAI